jgi:hypothetical protein
MGAINTISAGNNVVIKNGANVLFQAGQEIILYPDFTTEDGAEFTAQIDPCDPPAAISENGTNNTVGEYASFELQPDKEKQADSNETAIETISEPQAIETSSTDKPLLNRPFNIYPNPTNGNFFVEANDIQMIQLYDLLGNVVMQLNSPKGRQFAELDLSGYRKGIYIIKVTGAHGSEIRKLIYQ